MSVKRSLARSLLLAAVLVASLLLSACGGAGPTSTTLPPTQPASVQATQPVATQPAATNTVKAGPGAGGSTAAAPTAKSTTIPKATAAATATATKIPTAEAEATSATGMATGPASYRVHTVTRQDDAQGEVKDEGLVEVVMDPLAFHQTTTGDTQMEVIVVGQTLWMRFEDMPWNETDLSDEDLAASLQQFSQSELPVSIQDQTPLEDEIAWLLGQSSLEIAKDSLTRAGEETVNGVRCKHYLVDSTYTYTVEMTTPIQATSKVTILVQGEIWVADKAGWSPFVVRAWVTQMSTTEVSGHSSTDTVYVEQEVTDINEPITIEPPQ